MEESKYISYKIVFNKRVIQLTYDISFPEFKFLTIKSLIKEVLENLGKKSLNNEQKDFQLFCSCGKILEPEKLLFPKCSHPDLEDFEKERIKNEKYFLCKKQIIEGKKEELSKDEINSILKKALEKKKTKKNKQNKKKVNKRLVSISSNIKNKIKDLIIKKERGEKIIEKGYNVYYNESYYKELLEIGIDKNKAKGALRFAKNNKEEAASISMDENFYWDNKDYLYYDNVDVITKEKYDDLSIQEIKKEYPFMENKEEINKILSTILNLINNENAKERINNIDNNESDDISEDP